MHSHRRLLAALALATTLASASAAAPPADHVARLADVLVPHLPRTGTPPPIVVVERASVAAGVAGAEIEIPTGLLALLKSDAELAMILAYEQCRALPNAPRRSTAKSDSLGTQVARAAAVGAATGVVVEGVHDAMGSSNRVVRGAVVGAAATSTAVAVNASFGARRGSRTLDRSDDLAAADGMRALVSAGFDGRRALAVWDRLSASAVAGSDGGYGDRRANAKRRDAAARALRASGQTVTNGAGHAVGEDAYRIGVLASLQGWNLAAAPSDPEPVATPTEPAGRPDPPPAEAGAPWVVYRRSGGFTGWSAELRVFEDGSRWVSERRRTQEAGMRPPLPPEALASLRALVAAAAAAPPRRMTPEAKHLRDGMLRSIEVPDGAGRRSVTLSDGFVLTEGDQRLIRELEAALK